MLPDLLLALAMALVAAAAAWWAPTVIARLPEPEADPDPVPDMALADAHTEVLDSAEPAPQEPAVPDVKVPYTELASRPRLRPRLALASAIGAGSIGYVLGPDPSLPLWCFVSVLGVTLSYVDWTTRLLPYRLVAPSYPITMGLVLLAAVLSRDWDALLRAGVAWAVVYAAFTVMWLIYRRGIGYGDVRLCGILAMSLGWLGWSNVVIGMYAAFILGAVIGGVLVLVKLVDRRGYPFGPFLVVGTWLGVLFG